MRLHFILNFHQFFGQLLYRVFIRAFIRQGQAVDQFALLAPQLVVLFFVQTLRENLFFVARDYDLLQPPQELLGFLRLQSVQNVFLVKIPPRAVKLKRRVHYLAAEAAFQQVFVLQERLRKKRIHQEQLEYGCLQKRQF